MVCPFDFYGLCDICNQYRLFSYGDTGKEAQLENGSLGETWLSVVYNSDIRVEIEVLNCLFRSFDGLLYC